MVGDLGLRGRWGRLALDVRIKKVMPPREFNHRSPEVFLAPQPCFPASLRPHISAFHISAGDGFLRSIQSGGLLFVPVFHHRFKLAQSPQFIPRKNANKTLDSNRYERPSPA